MGKVKPQERKRQVQGLGRHEKTTRRNKDTIAQHITDNNNNHNNNLHREDWKERDELLLLLLPN